MMATATRAWTKLNRRLGGDDGNPLRRRCDVIESWLLPAAVAVFLAMCPAVAVATGAWVSAHNAATRQAQAAALPVRATLLEAAPGPVHTDHGANTWVVWTPAQWTAAGHTRIGDVPATAGSRAGTTMTIWLTRSGRVEPPPLTAAQVRDDVAAYTLLFLGALAIMLAALALVARKVLDRRRLASWETAWLAIGPRWSHQL